jgi:hypothetical protein
MPAPMIEGLDVLDDQKQLYQDLYDFNSKYAAYIQCYQKPGPDCPTSDSLTTLYNKITADIQTTKKNIPTSASSLDQYDTIQQQYMDVVKKRSELDVKMKEVYTTPDSIANIYKRHEDSTMYTGILFTALAASLLYYVFREL